MAFALGSCSLKLEASVTITGTITLLEDSASSWEENDFFDDVEEELLLK